MWKLIEIGLIAAMVGSLAVWYLTRDAAEPVTPTPLPQAADPAEPQPILSCNKLLIGQSSVACNLDIQGPGVLTIEINPDPVRTSWQLGVGGLTALTESCEFRGDFDRHNPASMQGRGKATLICPVAAAVDREWHELSFEGQLDISSLAIGIGVKFEG